MNSFKLFCLQNEVSSSKVTPKSVLPLLEKFTMKYGITTVYKTFDNSFESFEESLNNLIYEDKNFSDYKIIYILTEGDHNDLLIDNFRYSFEEIAEIFEAKLTDKILHFSNITQLNLEEETAQYFLDITGAKGVSGYANKTTIGSFTFDFEFFYHYFTTRDPIYTTEEIYKKNLTLAKTLGFTMYY